MEMSLPHDASAEANVLGAMMLNVEASRLGVSLPSEVFYLPKHELIHEIMLDLFRAGEPIDALTVNAAIMQRGLAGRCGGATYVHDLISGVISPAIIATAVQIVRDRAQLRGIVQACQRATQRAMRPGDASGLSVAAEVAEELARVRDTGQVQSWPTMSLDELAAPPPGFDWLVPGLLERNDRMIITAAEGVGKSMLLRQLAITLATGLHPFKFTPIEPRRVLMIDAENTQAQTHRKTRTMVQAAEHHGGSVDHDRFKLVFRTTGMTLSHPDDAQWLMRLCEDFRPDVICAGPLYHLSVGVDNNDERSISKVAQTLRKAQAINDSALIIEAHAAKGSAGFKRSVQPFGSSYWLRWPEFGFGLRLAEDLGEEAELLRIMDFVPWRGSRDERDWPKQIQQGSTGFPWVEAGRLPWKGPQTPQEAATSF